MGCGGDLTISYFTDLEKMEILMDRFRRKWFECLDEVEKLKRELEQLKEG